MQLIEARRLQKSWGKTPCSHPNIEREYYLGTNTGDWVCADCGREVSDEGKDIFTKTSKKD